jgi:agmatine deiminase
MVIDKETDLLYLANTLPGRHTEFYTQFIQTLTELEVPVRLISRTADIWARDYMPIQKREDSFIQFTYDPDYLQSKKWRSSITDVDAVIQQMVLRVEKSSIKLDGGNVVKEKDKVILCDKIFKENPTITPNKLIKALEQILEVSQVIIIPTAKGDFIGHADGYVRFLDNDTVLVNNYRAGDAKYSKRLLRVLQSAGLECTPIPYNPYPNKTYLDATGIYINYLQMQQGIVLPVFGIKEDQQMVKQFEQLLSGVAIRTVPSTSVAREGGVLNCISWNIYKKP